MPVWGFLNGATWFGVINLLGSGIGIAASQLLIVRLEGKGSVSRKGVVLFASAGYIVSLLLFAAGRNFWFALAMFLLAGLMRAIKEPVAEAWMNEHVEERLRASVFSANGQMDALGQIIGGPIVGLAAQQFSVPWGLACTALLMTPALLITLCAGRADEKR